MTAATNSATSIISVDGLTKRFGKFTAVDDVSMEIAAGKVHGFLGPNGSGKTTTIRMMCGLLDPSDGKVTVLGMPVPEQAAEVRRRVGYMTQRFSLYGDLTIAENMQFLCRVHGMGRKHRRQRIADVIDQFNLSNLRDRTVGPMSGGQKRRIALAAATLTEPTLLILDEPTSEVDPNTRREMWEWFFELAQQGTTLLVSTHLMDEAERCHRLTIMNHGQVVADGEVETLKAELPAKVVRLVGGEVTPLVPDLSRQPGVMAVTQVGQTLRILCQPQQAESLLTSKTPAGRTLELVSPDIEDVFVFATEQLTEPA